MHPGEPTAPGGRVLAACSVRLPVLRPHEVAETSETDQQGQDCAHAWNSLMRADCSRLSVDLTPVSSLMVGTFGSRR